MKHSATCNAQSRAVFFRDFILALRSLKFGQSASERTRVREGVCRRGRSVGRWMQLACLQRQIRSLSRILVTFLIHCFCSRFHAKQNLFNS